MGDRIRSGRLSCSARLSTSAPSRAASTGLPSTSRPVGCCRRRRNGLQWVAAARHRHRGRGLDRGESLAISRVVVAIGYPSR